MNKVFRVIFNVKKGCYTVVPETAKTSGKSALSKTGSIVTAVALGVIVSLGGLVTTNAATVGKLVASDSYNLYWGGSYQDESKAQGMYNTAFGKNTSAGVTADANYYGDIQTGSAGEYQYGMAWGKDAHAANNAATAFGYKTIASGVAATAFGEGTRATGINATAFGQETKATNKYTTAFGYRTNANGENATALGAETNASGQSSLAAGEKTIAAGLSSTALGHHSEALADNGTALSGGIVESSATSSVAMGLGAVAEVSDAVALGSGSVANREAGREGYKYNPGRTNSTWIATANAIAVGHVDGKQDDAENITRQITGVAAGTEDTDVVNVAQLKASEEDAKTALDTAKSELTDVIDTTKTELTTAIEASKAKSGRNITVDADNKVNLNDQVYLGGDHTADNSNIQLDGTNGNVVATASKGMFSGAKTISFDGDGLAVTGTDYAGRDSKKSTTIQNGKVRISDAQYGSEKYTEIDGGSVRTESLKVLPNTKESLEFKQGGLVVRSNDSRLFVDKNGISQSVDNGRGQSNSVKVTQKGTVFRTNDGTGATETVVVGEYINAGNIEINGEDKQSTITGLSNTTLDAKDFGTQGRAATEEQVKAVRSEIKDSGTVINNQITNIDNRVTNVETNINSINTNITDINQNITNINSDVTNIKSDVTNINSNIQKIDTKIDNHINIINGDIKDIKQDVNAVTSKVSTLEERANKTDTRIQSVEKTVSEHRTNCNN